LQTDYFYRPKFETNVFTPTVKHHCWSHTLDCIKVTEIRRWSLLLL